MSDFLNTADLARCLGLSVRRVEQMIEEGRILGVLRASERGHYRIPKSEADRLVREAERRVAG